MLLSGAVAFAFEPHAAEQDPPDSLAVLISDARQVPLGWREPWDRLAHDRSESNVFAERWFVAAGIRHLLPEGPTSILSVWRGRDLLGLMPVRIERRYGRTPVAHVQNWAHHQSFLGAPLVRRGEETVFWTEML